MVSVNDIGKLTGILLTVVTNEFKNIKDANKIACYAGVAPFPYTSGVSLKGRNKVSAFSYKPLKNSSHGVL